MNELPSVTIVIPAKNEAKYITRCLACVAALDYPHDRLDICVVDNGSSDNTVTQASMFPGVRVLERTGNIGAVRNFGGKNTLGEVIAFLDADCLPDTQWLRRAIRRMTEQDAAVVSAVLSPENSDCPWIEKCWLSYLRARHTEGVNFVKTIYSFCFVVRRRVMEEVGWFNEDLVTCEDSDLGFRISQLGYRLIVDTDIQTVHLRNAKTAKQFFLRELWHGRSNFQNLFVHNFEWSELPSLLVPAGYLLLLAALPFVFVFGGFTLLTIGLAITVMVPLGIAVSRRADGWGTSIFAYAIIWFLYLTARGLGLFLKIGVPWT